MTSDRVARHVRYSWRRPEPAHAARGPVDPRFGRVNWTGFWTVTRRESNRFLKNPGITILPPLVSELLFIVVFGVALGTRVGEVEGVSYIHFMIPGIVMMGAIVNAYINPSFSVFDARRDRYIDDMLSAPLSAVEMALATALAGALRGLLVGGLILVASLVVVPWFPHPLIVVLMLVLTSVAFALLGLLVGLAAEEYDHISNVLTFGLNPLIFFGAVFYSLRMVEENPVLAAVTRLNPITYMVDGIRYGMIGVRETNLVVGVAFLVALNVALTWLSVRLFERGWKLKA